MTNKDRLAFINKLEQLKNLVLKVIDFQNNLDEIPLEISSEYEEIYKHLDENRDTKKMLNFRPVYYGTIRDTIYANKIGFSDQDEALSKEKWSDYLSYGIELSQTDIENVEYGVPHNIDASIIQTVEKSIKINKLQLSNFRFFIDDEKNNTFEPNGQNMLVYGENGSGKSSLFKAFEFLASDEILKNDFEENKNIFNKAKDTFLEFKFNNEQEIKIHEGNLELNDDYPYIKALSIFKPVLEYKHLLKIHYQTDKKKDEINIYEMLKELFKDYPCKGNEVLSSIQNPKEYFEKLEETINKDFLNNINKNLEFFDDRFSIEKFHFDMSFLDDGKGVEFIVNLKINFKNVDKLLSKYHLFLNEARLTALAISIYFAVIKNISDKLENNSLKLLVLDDLLISLDMSNRMSLIKILKDEFSDFQIFFFTHDKGLFETFKDKMEWKAYEIYVNKSKEEFEIPFVKKSNTLLEQAKYQKHHKNFDCSANLLRQCTEKLMCRFLPSEKLVSKSCKNLDLFALIDNAISFENNKKDTNQKIIDMLAQLQTYRQMLFNIGSHYNDANIYERELQEAIDILEKLAHLIII